MRSLFSHQIADFSAIYSDDVELVSVVRRSADQDSHQPRVMPSEDFRAQWEQRLDDQSATKQALSASENTDFVQWLNGEINSAVQVLGDLLECDGVGVRVATLHSPMCPRFHTDKVPCRLLITLKGPGTEWIASDDIDEELFLDRTNNKLPVNRGGSVKQLSTGSWSLLKGGSWTDQFCGVVHRSPPYEGERLIVSLDPMFN